MQLVPNWADVLKKAWSVRFMAAAFLFSALTGAMTLLPELPVPFWARAAAIALAPMADLAAFIARHVSQKGLSDGED